MNGLRVGANPTRAAVVDGLPLYLGYAVVGVTFGAYTGEAGLSPAAAVTMSALVYAGAAQFLAVELLRTGASPWFIALLTSLLNVRLLLFAAMLVPQLQSLPRRRQVLLAFATTDETALVGVRRAAEGSGEPADYTAVLMTLAYATWVVATAVGVLAAGGVAIPGAAAFALPALLAAVLGLSLSGARNLLLAVLAAGAAVLLGSFFPPGWLTRAAGQGSVAATVLLMAALTFSIRLTPFLISPVIWGQPAIRRFMGVLPVVVTAALLGPMLISPDGEPWLAPDNTHLLAGLGVIAVAAVTRSLALAVVAGLGLKALGR